MATKKVTKKTPEKIIKKAEVVEKTETVKTEEVKPISYATPQKQKKTNKTLITFIAIVIIIGLLWAFRSSIVVATVNGKPIFRSDFDRELEKNAGKQSMNDLVTKILVFQEADKKGIKISDSEVNSEMKTISDQLSKSGQSLDEALKSRGLTKNDLADQIRIKKIVDQLVGKNITVTDKEVDDYIAANKDSLPQAEQDNPSQATKDSIKQRLLSQKVSDKFQEWLDQLQKNAKISYFIQI